MGAKRPILAFVPPNSNAAAVLRATGTGEIFEQGEDREAVARNCSKMMNFVRQYRTRELEDPVSAQASDLQKYTRPFQARQIADIAEAISAHNPVQRFSGQ